MCIYIYIYIYVYNTLDIDIEIGVDRFLNLRDIGTSGMRINSPLEPGFQLRQPQGFRLFQSANPN